MPGYATPLLATEAPRRPPPRRAAPGVLGGALSAKVTAGKIRRKSKDLEASLDMMAASVLLSIVERYQLFLPVL